MDGGVEIPEEPIITEDHIERNTEQIREDNALSFLGFKDKGRVPQTIINLFIENITQLVRNSIQFAEAEVKQRLQAVRTSIGAIPGLK